MKGWFFILFFLFLILVSSAETISDTWLESSTTHEEVAPGGSGIYTSYNFGIGTFTLGDAAQLRSMKLYTMKIPNAHVSTSKDSEYNDVTFKIGATVVGSGLAGYSTGADHTFVHYWFQDLDLSGFSGSQVMTVDGVPTSINSNHHYYKDQAAPTNQQVYLRTYFAGRMEWYGWRQTTHTVQMSYEFKNTITVEFAEPLSSVTTYRDDGNQSMFNITQNSVQILYEDSLNTGTNVTYSNSTNSFTVTGENQYGDFYSHVFSGVTTSVGTIELNQSSYTEPENIQINTALTTYNFTDHSYYIITEVREDEGTWDNVAGTYNGTTKITTATATKILDIDTWLYDLPLWVRVKLVDYNKISGEYSTIYTTGMVRYNAPTPDSIKFGGTVIDADTNQIISGALVSVEGVTTTSDTTNAFGEFLMYLYPGIYTVTTSKTGYQTSTSEDLLMEYDNTWAQIYLTPIGYGNGTLYGNVNDVDTGYAIQDIHVIISNATDSISAYTSSGGYYEATGLAQSSTYTIQAVKSGYYTYNGSITTEASGATHKSFNMVPETATPTPTATVLPTSTYPGGEGHEWTNDEIVTMLRVLVPGFFLLMLVFLLLAVMLGIGGNNGNSGQGRSGLSEIWRR